MIAAALFHRPTIFYSFLILVVKILNGGEKIGTSAGNFVSSHLTNFAIVAMGEVEVKVAVGLHRVMTVEGANPPNKLFLLGLMMTSQINQPHTTEENAY